MGILSDDLNRKSKEPQLSPKNCLRCGKEIGREDFYCPDCQARSEGQKPIGFWILSIILSSLLLTLTGLLLWHGGFRAWDFSLDAILERPAVVINGEKISRADLKARLKIIGGILERQYGKDLFAGNRGRALLINLENQVLEGMMEEKLVAQEAKKLGIQISDEQVRQELEQVTREIFGTWENFQARLREDGMSREDLQNNLRHMLLLEAIKRAKIQKGSDPETSFNAWLLQARRSAQVVVYYSGNDKRSASLFPEDCCTLGGSAGCSGRQSYGGLPVDPNTESQAKKIALEAYRKTNPSEQEVIAKVTDYGCHIQVDIHREGKVEKSYTYQGGKVFEIF